jgi:hypothetical protein
VLFRSRLEKRIAEHIIALSGVQTQLVSAYEPYGGENLAASIEELIKKVSL